MHFLLCLMANIPASVHTDLISAPVALGHFLAKSSNLMFLSMDIVLARILNMWARPSRSGNPNSIFLSILPGLVRAASKVSGLLVAMMTLMFPHDSNPSSWFTISNMVLCTSWSPPEPSSNQAPPMASTSSKKIMAAFLVFARAKSSLTIHAPSPIYFFTSSEPMHLMKHASVLLAIAHAVRVFPVPGGPYSITPFGGSIPSWVNFSGLSNGSSRTSLNFYSCSLHPPISLYVTSGFSSISMTDTWESIL